MHFQKLDFLELHKYLLTEPEKMYIKLKVCTLNLIKIGLWKVYENFLAICGIKKIISYS